MDYRGVLLVALVAGASVAAATTSCSSPDPGQIVFSERPKGTTGDLTSGGTSSGGVTDGGGTGGEAGPMAEGGAEGGTSSSSGDPVFSTTTFAAGAAGPPVAVAKAFNPAHQGDCSGKDCIQGGCHLDARPWAFGGTLYSDAAGSSGRVANAEVRITGPDGKVFASTYTDVDGNFWYEPSNGNLMVPANSRVGVRIAGKMHDMAGSIGGSGQVGCQKAAGCHGAASPGKVFLN